MIYSRLGRIARLMAAISLILVMSAGSPSAQYNIHNITPRQTPTSVTVTAPEVDATWAKGEKYTISWKGSGIRGGVKIFLENAEGGMVAIGTSPMTNGSYDWKVGPLIIEDTYRVVVTSGDRKVRSESTGRVTIVKPTPGGLKQAAGAAQTNVSTAPRATIKARPPVTAVTQAQTSVAEQPVTVHESTQPQAQADPAQLDQAGTNQVTGFVYPDFEIRDIEYRTGRLHVNLRNNGTPYDGMISIRVRASEPTSGSAPFDFDDTIDLAVSLGPGQVGDLQLSRFLWPSPTIDHHWLIFALEVDPAGQVTESNEQNNRYQASICRPCGMEITSLSRSSFTQGADIGTFGVYGSFGSVQGSKRLRFQWQGKSYDLPVGSWNNVSLLPDYDIAGLRPGTYKITAFCRHPAIDATHASNTVELKVNAPDYGGRESPIDARNIADALAEEFTEGLDFSSKVESLSTHALGGDRVEVRCHIRDGQGGRPDIVLVTHELWRDGYRVAYWEDPAFGWNPAGGYLAHTFEALTSGDYEYRATIRSRSGSEDSQTKSFVM